MPRRSINTAIAIVMISVTGATAAERPVARWPDAFLTRVEILALMQTLNADLLASRSATLTLEKWCADHRMATEPKVVARRIDAIEKPASAETRDRLRVAPNEIVKHRRVQLSCGGHVLSEADNWYVPGRLSDEMNRLLETTDTPFGKVVRPAQPFRRTIDARMLWSPLPQGWETRLPGENMESEIADRSIEIPREIFEHRAIVYTGDQTPFSEVDEKYTKEILDFDASPAGP